MTTIMDSSSSTRGWLAEANMLKLMKLEGAITWVCLCVCVCVCVCVCKSKQVRGAPYYPTVLGNGTAHLLAGQTECSPVSSQTCYNAQAHTPTKHATTHTHTHTPVGLRGLAMW